MNKRLLGLWQHREPPEKVAKTRHRNQERVSDCRGGGKGRRRKRGGESAEERRVSSLLRAFSSALSPPPFPSSSAIANSLLVFCVWFSLLFKGAPCGGSATSVSCYYFLNHFRDCKSGLLEIWLVLLIEKWHILGTNSVALTNLYG